MSVYWYSLFVTQVYDDRHATYDIGEDFHIRL